jgi:hypothetical protein
MDSTDVYRIFHPATTKHTFFLAVHVNLSQTDYILGSEAGYSTYKKAEAGSSHL